VVWVAWGWVLKYSVEQIKKVGLMLRRRAQIANWLKEIDDKIEVLERQKRAANKELEAIREDLDQNYAGLEEAASELVSNVAGSAGGGSRVSVYNPRYVTNADKKELLAQILRDFKEENPGADRITFQQVKSILAVRYGVKTKTIGNFFRRQLPSYRTTGGNKLKVILLDRPE
jgi:hypothetical protein